MNREQRRKAGIKRKEPVINVRFADIEAMKQQATQKGVDTAFLLMLAIPTMIIHDKFGQLMKRDGREELFVNLCLELYEMYKEGYVDITDLHKVLETEAGVKIRESKRTV